MAQRPLPAARRRAARRAGRGARQPAWRASSSRAPTPVGQVGAHRRPARARDRRARAAAAPARHRPRRHRDRPGRDRDAALQPPLAVPHAAPGPRPRRPARTGARSAGEVLDERHGEEDVTVLTQDAVVETLSADPARAHAGAGGDRGDLARGRRHRHHERDAGLGLRAHLARSACCARSAPGAARSSRSSWPRRRCSRPRAACVGLLARLARRAARWCSSTRRCRRSRRSGRWPRRSRSRWRSACVFGMLPARRATRLDPVAALTEALARGGEPWPTCSASRSAPSPPIACARSSRCSASRSASPR